jgi:phospholipid transport system substrate-binding protein
MRYMFRALLVLALAWAVPHPAAAAADDAAGFVSSLGDKTLNLLNQKLPPAQLEPKFREILHEGFDVEQISRFVLGPYWRQADEAQRKEFMKLFEDYIVKAYSIRFSEYTGEQFKIAGSRPEGDNSALVSSQILRPNGAPPVRVDWRVNKTAEGYKIGDVVVENVSMMLTQKQEFSSIIQRNGGQLEALLKMLREKVKNV